MAIFFAFLVPSILQFQCQRIDSSPALKTGQNANVLKTKIYEQTVDINYLLFLPKSYNEQKSDWPMIVYLHGASLRGTDVNRVKRYGLPRMVEKNGEFPFVLLSPQSPPGKAWQPERVDRVVEHVLSAYRIDPDRVYLTGLSLGGYGTWATAAAFSNRYAAIAPISGGGVAAFVDSLKRTPVWAFHGAKDTAVPLSESQSMVDALNIIGGDVRFTVFPKGEHDVFLQVYRNPDLYEWFLQHSKVRSFIHF